MRVISGKARGTKINTIESMTTRPTLDRVKESLFNILQSRILNAKVLDLFAGSGALGIEALSRGAEKAIFCDNNAQAAKIIKENLIKTKNENSGIVFNKDYRKCLRILQENKECFDLIFLDPPYKENIAIDAVKLIIENKILDKDGIIVIETDEAERELKQLEAQKDIVEIVDKRKYGRANLIFVKERKKEEN